MRYFDDLYDAQKHTCGPTHCYYKGSLHLDIYWDLVSSFGHVILLEELHPLNATDEQMYSK
jgi:hypothetical protein